jgi:hypothetical protein
MSIPMTDLRVINGRAWDLSGRIRKTSCLRQNVILNLESECPVYPSDRRDTEDYGFSFGGLDKLDVAVMQQIYTRPRASFLVEVAMLNSLDRQLNSACQESKPPSNLPLKGAITVLFIRRPKKV